MKVTFEIDKIMLTAAAGLVACQYPEAASEIMDFVENDGEEDILIDNVTLVEMSKQNKDVKQLPVLIALLALGFMFQKS